MYIYVYGEIIQMFQDWLRSAAATFQAHHGVPPEYFSSCFSLEEHEILRLSGRLREEMLFPGLWTLWLIDKMCSTENSLGTQGERFTFSFEKVLGPGGGFSV